MPKSFDNIKNTKPTGYSAVINDKGSLNSSIKTMDPSGVSIDFRYYIYRPFNFKDFTNFTKSEEKYLEIQEVLFRDFIPHYSNRKFGEITSESKHNHYITDSAKDKLDDILEACEKSRFIEKAIVDNKEKTYYQLYLPSGMRVVCLLNGTTFFVLFLDPHHLIYRAEEFDKDYKHFNYNPSFLNEDRVLKFDDTKIDECYTCEHMKKYLES